MSLPPLFPVLVFAAAPASGLESWGLPDLRQEDKQGHAAIGFAVGAIADAATKSLSPRSTWLTRALIGAASAAVIGAAKEACDSHSRHHDADPKDALATVAGGAIGVLVIEIRWRF